MLDRATNVLVLLIGCFALVVLAVAVSIAWTEVQPWEQTWKLKPPEHSWSATRDRTPPAVVHGPWENYAPRQAAQTGPQTKYIVTSPDGTKYQVTAPAGASQAQVLAYAQSHHAQPNPFDQFDTAQRDQFGGVPVATTVPPPPPGFVVTQSEAVYPKYTADQVTRAIKRAHAAKAFTDEQTLEGYLYRFYEPSGTVYRHVT